MKIECIAAAASEKQTVWNLFQFYCYDSTEWDPDDVGSNGLYGLDSAYFSQYWLEPGWSAHLIKVDQQIAGFLLIEPTDAPGVNCAEFADLFILKKYRNQGVAKHIVRQVIVESKQPWVVTVFDDDRSAKVFWSKMFELFNFGVIRQLTDAHGRASKVYLLNEQCNGEK